MLPLALLATFQSPKPTATVRLDTALATVGKPVAGTVTLTMPQGMHGYQNPPTDPFENPIKLSIAGPGLRLAKVAYPKGVALTIAGLDKPSKVYEGTIQIPFTVIASRPGSKLAFKIAYQLCTASNCYPPAVLLVSAPIRFVAAKKASA